MLRRGALALAILTVLLSTLRLHAHPPGHDCEDAAQQTTGLAPAVAGTPACPDPGPAPDGDPADPHAPDDCGSCQCPPPLLAVLAWVTLPIEAAGWNWAGDSARLRIPDSANHPPEPPPVRAA